MLIVDIETTGFLNAGGLICEVGIVELDLSNGDKKIIYNELVKEDGFNESHSNSWIFSNSDLKFSDVAEAKPLDKQAIQNILDTYPVTAYNKKFDFGFLRNRGINISKELCCPMLKMTGICKIPSRSRYGGYKWPSVEESWKHLFPEIAYDEKHRGGDDALHEAMICHELHKIVGNLEE